MIMMKKKQKLQNLNFQKLKILIRSIQKLYFTKMI